MRNEVFLSILSAIMLILLTGCASRESDLQFVDLATEASAVDEQSSGAKENTQLATEVAAIGTSEASSVMAADSSSIQIEESLSKIAVFICGAVENPGVYELLEGSRVDDAVKAAGGFSEDADRCYVNLAAKLSDGVKLMIPTKEEAEDKTLASSIESFDKAPEGTDSASEASGLVNINTSTAEHLKSLPGIGDAVAGRIIKYREENGAFKEISDIMKISGIKEKLFSKIKDNITV